MRHICLTLVTLTLFAVPGCNNSTTSRPPAPSNTIIGPPPASAAPTLKIGYVLHGMNDFTQVIMRGAKDAGKALGVDVQVVAPSSFTAAPEAIGMFEGMIQKKKDGLVVVPMPGEQWIKPIKEATDAGIPVVTANITSANSTSSAWFGQDEYQSGITLATELRKMLEADNKKSGTILIGICAPGDATLLERYKGFKKGMEGSGYTLSDPKDVGTANTANYNAWETLASKDTTIVAAVGLCSMDIPNLAKLKTRSKANWIIEGYDLNQDTLDSIKTGATHLTLGQNPYLQGYLPVLALVQHLRDKKPLPKGWVNVGTEVVTKQNIDSLYLRETDRTAETKWYADDIARNFADMAAMAKPLPIGH